MSLLETLERQQERRRNPYEEASRFVYGGGATSNFLSSVARANERNDLLQRPFAVEDEDRYTRRPTTMIGKAFDLLSRGEYFAASILHSLTNEESETMGQVIGQAVTEAVSPTHRYTMHDVMKNVAPEFMERRPLTAGALSFAASIALDPLTYLTFGASGIKVAGKAGQLAVNVKRGKETGRFFETVAKQLGEEGVTRHAEKTALEGLQAILSPAKYDDELVAAGAKIAKKAEKKGGTLPALSAKKQRAYDIYKRKVFSDNAREEATKALDTLGYSAETLADKGGVKLFGKTVANSETVARVADKVGLTDVMRKLAEIPSVKAVRNALKDGELAVVRNADGSVNRAATDRAQTATTILGGMRDIGQATKGAVLSRFSQKYNITKAIKAAGFDDGMVDEFMALRAMAETKALQAESDAVKLAKDLTEGLSEKERKEVMEVLYQAQTASYREREAYQKVLDGPQAGPPALPGQQLSMQQFDRATEHEVLQRVLNRSNLTDRQREVATAFSKMNQDMAKLEMEANLLNSYVANYTPTFHKNFRSSPTEYLQQRRALAEGKEPPAFTPAKQRIFKTIEHARNAGYEPITDIAQVATLRYSLHKSAMEQTHMMDALASMFGGKSKIPDAIARDLKRTMNIHVDSNDLFAEMKPVIGVFDRLQGFFKTGATVLNPAFAAKQIVGSEAQRIAGGSSIAEMGLRLLRNLKHPSAALHATYSIMRGKVPEGIVTDMGVTYTKRDIEKLLDELPVFKNMSVEGITAGGGRSAQRVAEHADRQVALGKIKAGEIPEYKGMMALAKRGTRYMELPQMVEDTNRYATWMDNLMRGFTPEEAYKRMEAAHFNYSSGVTEFEEKFMKRLMPFYQFTKFATVLTGNMLTKTPGRAATLTKVQREAMRAYGKLDPLYDGDTEGLESLTPSERHALPGFLFEQPSAFAGWDPELREAVFRIFGGVQFLDVLNIIHFDDNGEWNTEAAQRTLVQGSMAQVTPFIKAPLEAIFNKEFFTGFDRSEDGSGRRDIDADTFFTALSGAIGARATGGTGFGAGIGAGVGRLAQRVGAFEAAKQLVGWETAVDPRDGVEKTYLNPTLMLISANFFPEVRTALGIAREDLDATEHVMKNLFGVSTIKLDLQDRQQRKLNDATQAMRDERARFRRLMQSGRKGRAEKAYADLQEAVSVMQKEHELLLSSTVRGPQ